MASPLCVFLLVAVITAVVPADTSNATAPSPAQPTLRESGYKHRYRNWIIGAVVGTLAGVMCGLFVSVLFKLALRWRYRRRKRSATVIFSIKLIRRAKQLAFLEKDDGLASLAMIGRGGCGEVYKARLPVERNGEEPLFIAIKVVNKMHGIGDNLSDEERRELEHKSHQIQSEIRTVGHIRHRNLLPLAAHLSRLDCHFLVYDYMKNGSLHDALKEARDGRVMLPWPARLRMAVGVAEGLEYLHFSHRPQIIHRDLKPANILLDDDLEPRITDFGLAKIMPDAREHVTVSNIAGSFGYMAPEYYQTKTFTAKCDVYSFGVILAVLVTGKEPTDDYFCQEDTLCLVDWLRSVMQANDHAEAIDPAIADPVYEKQIALVLRTAIACTADHPRERPTAKEVAYMLSQIRN